jgi:hypothetical protein
MQKIKAAIKSALRPLLLPIALPILHRVRRFSGMRAEIDNLHASWHQSVPGFVNAAASVAALAREQARMKREHEAAIAQLKAAIDELRGNATSAGPRILAAEKVERARAEGARLFIGRGPSPLDSYLHVDATELPGVDIVARADALPFEAAELSEIVASHVLEGFTQDELERKLLPYWAGLLEPGGELRAVADDANAMIHATGRGEFRFEQLRNTLFGGDARRNIFTAESLAATLRAAGLQDVRVIAEGRRSGSGWELEIAARAAAK